MRVFEKSSKPDKNGFRALRACTRFFCQLLFLPAPALKVILAQNNFERTLRAGAGKKRSWQKSLGRARSARNPFLSGFDDFSKTLT